MQYSVTGAPEVGAVHETLIVVCPTTSAASPVGALAAAEKKNVQVMFNGMSKHATMTIAW